MNFISIVLISIGITILLLLNFLFVLLGHLATKEYFINSPIIKFIMDLLMVIPFLNFILYFIIMNRILHNNNKTENGNINM